MNKVVIGILEKTRNILTDEKNWTQGSYAKDKAGDPVSSFAPEATCWCLSGAMDLAAWGEPISWFDNAVDHLSAQQLVQDVVVIRIGDYTRSRFNDTHTHAEVLEVLDEAIELANKSL